MSLETDLYTRADSKCELCSASNELSAYTVPPRETKLADDSVLLCEQCLSQINHAAALESKHWHCLNDSMWNPTPAVQVLAWRMLKRLDVAGQSWAQNALDSLYLDDELLAWANSAQANDNEHGNIKHFDSNGVSLSAGDTVTLTKDLNVKGAGFTAKRGTAVRSISLVADNSKHIEGRINGQRIVILTEFVKKQ